jgi:hypothetical protein
VGPAGAPQDANRKPLRKERPPAEADLGPKNFAAIAEGRRHVIIGNIIEVVVPCPDVC